MMEDLYLLLTRDERCIFIRDLLSILRSVIEFDLARKYVEILQDNIDHKSSDEFYTGVIQSLSSIFDKKLIILYINGCKRKQYMSGFTIPPLQINYVDNVFTLENIIVPTQQKSTDSSVLNNIEPTLSLPLPTQQKQSYQQKQTSLSVLPSYWDFKSGNDGGGTPLQDEFERDAVPPPPAASVSTVDRVDTIINDLLNAPYHPTATDATATIGSATVSATAVNFDDYDIIGSISSSTESDTCDTSSSLSSIDERLIVSKQKKRVSSVMKKPYSESVKKSKSDVVENEELILPNKYNRYSKKVVVAAAKPSKNLPISRKRSIATATKVNVELSPENFDKTLGQISARIGSELPKNLKLTYLEKKKFDEFISIPYVDGLTQQQVDIQREVFVSTLQAHSRLKKICTNLSKHVELRIDKQIDSFLGKQKKEFELQTKSFAQGCERIFKITHNIGSNMQELSSNMNSLNSNIFKNVLAMNNGQCNGCPLHCYSNINLPSSKNISKSNQPFPTCLQLFRPPAADFK